MKIVDIQPVPLSYTFPDDQAYYGSTWRVDTVSSVIVRIITDEGGSGLGETLSGLLVPDIVCTTVNALKPLLVGEDPRNIENICKNLYSKTLHWGRRGLGVSVFSAIELALWDLLGKVQQVPVYQLLGGGARDRLRLYASGGVLKHVENPIANMLQELRTYVAKGFEAVKIRIGFSPVEDKEIVEKARELLGDNVDLMVDIGTAAARIGMPTHEVLSAVRLLEPYGLYWLEEPTHPDNIEGYAKIAAATDIPIAGIESLTTIYEAKEILDHHAVDILQIDATHAGGLLECMRIASLAASHCIPVAPHSWSTAVGLAANFHLAFAIPNALIGEYPMVNYPLQNDLLLEPFNIKNGYLLPPTTPGLGVELAETIIEKYRYVPGSGFKITNR